MIISHKHKFIFIHIPKCAGSSIARSLREYYGYDEKLDNADLNEFAMFRCDRKYGNADYLNEHSTYNEVKEYFDNNNLNINDYFKFSFVRNPWARRMSQYKYGRRMFKKTNAEWTQKYDKLSFCEFIKMHCDCQLNWISKEAFPPSSKKKHEVAIDYIGRCENLQEDFNNVCDKIGIPHRQLPHSNKTKHKHYTEYYGDETREIVAETTAKDIEYFGYEFGE